MPLIMGGHTHLTHSFLMASGDERQVPFCHSCQTNVTVKHILTDCIDYSLERRHCRLTGKSMTDLLGESCEVSDLMRFLKRVNLYRQV